jgi:hypothetical protein
LSEEELERLVKKILEYAKRGSISTVDTGLISTVDIGVVSCPTRR